MQAQDTINGANAEINRLRNTSSDQQDLNIDKINGFNTDIDTIYDTIAVLKDTKFEAESKVRELDREIGPIKYVAELLYGSSEQSIMDKSVRIFILLFVFVFDPLAIMLLIAANQTLIRYGIKLENTGPKSPTDDDPEEWFDSPLEEDSRYIYGDTMPDIGPVDSTPYSHNREIIKNVPSAVDDAADIMSSYTGNDKTFFESINEPAVPEVKNIDTQSTTDIVEQIAQTNKSEQDLNMILKGKTKSQLLLMAEDGGVEIPAQLSKAEIVANIIANYDSITKKKI